LIRIVWVVIGVAIITLCVVMLARGDPLYPKQRRRGKHEK
jgi:hypothetical protein